MKTPFGRQPGGLRLERMQSSRRYRDGEFHNVHPLLSGLASGAMPSMWGERVSPVGFAGPKRFHPVPVKLGD